MRERQEPLLLARPVKRFFLAPFGKPSCKVHLHRYTNPSPAKGQT